MPKHSKRGKEPSQKIMLELDNSMRKKKKKMSLDPYLTLHTTQKLITNRNVKVKTIKLLEEITGKYLSNLGIGKDFLNSTQKSTI